MIDTEFNDWLQDFGRSFPSIKAWLVTLGPDDSCGVREVWREAMQDIELRDAKAVTQRMMFGDDPPPSSFDRELTAAHVRRLAKLNYERRMERSGRREKSEYELARSRGVPDGPSAKGYLQQIEKLMDANPGLSARDAAEQIMPPAEENPDGRRYDCHTCLDSGIVMVWASVSIQAALRGELMLPGKRRTCGAPCSCRAGDHYVWRNSGDPPKGWSGWLNADAVYSPDRYCLCTGNDTESLIAIESFKDWVAERALAADRREPAFADWNAGGGKENAVAN